MFRNFLAPIDGYTDLAFRLLAQRYGAEACCVPLVNSSALCHDRSKVSLVDAHPDEENIGAQIVGNDPAAIGKACRIIIQERPFLSWLNLNCGCPSAKTMKCGGGSAMLRHPEKIIDAVKEMRKSCDIELSVKIRISGNTEETAELCNRIEAAGADFIVIHGRTPKQGYCGEADWEFIKSVKNQVGIKVVGNGDITSSAQGERYVKEGYCDSFMVGRAAMSNPMLFSGRKPEDLEQRLSLLGEYISIHRRYRGEPLLKDVRMRGVKFISGVSGAARIRKKIWDCRSVEEITGMTG